MESFSEILRWENEGVWVRAKTHRFVTELCDGTINPETMAAYLIQDHRFVDNVLGLLCAAMLTADTFEARLRYSRFAGMVAGEENTYFERSFEALGVTQAQKSATPDTNATRRFKEIMKDAAATRSYAAILAVLNVAEGLYLDWAESAPKPLPTNFVHAEWITLHDNPYFNDFVAFLKSEFDRIGPKDSDLSREFFERAIDAELAFFDSAYEQSDSKQAVA